MEASTPVRVAICVATYRRPEGLRRVLDALANSQVAPPETDRPVEIRAVVVDNDLEGPERCACEPYESRFALGLRYAIEPNRGISYARNRLVAEAGDDVEFIAMLDDDEVPTPEWIGILLKTQARFNADVVAGPIVPFFPSPPPTFIEQGRFFERPRHVTGHEMTHAATGNVLVRRGVFERTGGFDNRFALVGGEDQHFFRRARSLGARIVWADEAAIEEWIPPSRANQGWLLRRAYRSGLTNGQIDRDRGSHLVIVPLRIIRGLGRIAQGLAVAATAAVRFGDRRRIVYTRGLQLVWRGAGMIYGVLGGNYEEYRVIHPV